MRYIDIDADRFIAFLTSKGFSRTVQNRELVFVKQHERNPNLYVKVYSSISVNATLARGVGSDCIRVVAIHDGNGKSFGIWKATRTYRTGSQEAVEQRTYDRMRECYAALNRWRKQ